MLEFKNITKKYGDFTALDKLNFSLPKSGVYGLLGKNGAGKSTCMKILAGVFYPESGSYLFNGQDVTKSRNVSWKRNIGYLPDLAPVYEDLKVIDNLLFWAKLKGLPQKQMKAMVDIAMQRCGLTEMRHRYGATLSKGYRQRLGLAQAILNEPSFIILDEPSAGLDPQQNLEMRNLIRDLGEEHCVLLSSHLLHEVQVLCSKVLVLHKGKLTVHEQADLEKIRQVSSCLKIKFFKRLTEEQEREFKNTFKVLEEKNSEYHLEIENSESSLQKIQEFSSRSSLLISSMDWAQTDMETVFIEWMEDRDTSLD